MFTDILKRVLSDLGLADTEDNCRNVLASVVGLGCSVAELPESSMSRSTGHTRTIPSAPMRT